MHKESVILVYEYSNCSSVYEFVKFISLYLHSNKYVLFQQVCNILSKLCTETYYLLVRLCIKALSAVTRSVAHTIENILHTYTNKCLYFESLFVITFTLKYIGEDAWKL